MTIKKFGIFILAVFASITIQSCKDDVVPVNEEEVINEIIVTLKDDANNTYTLAYKDSDGGGPLSPVFTEDKLPANKSLTASIQLLNTLATPSENITNEVLEEADEHQFFYQFSGSGNPVVSYTDSDVNGKPIGIQFKLDTKSAYLGVLKVILRHQPNKEASGVASGDITNAGGATDVDVDFNITIE